MDVSSNNTAEVGPMDVAVFADGSFITVFSQGTSIFGRKFDVAKTPVGGQFTIASVPANFDLSAPKVAVAENGNFVVVFTESDFSGANSDEDVLFKLFSSNNTVIASGQVNPTDTVKSQNTPDVAMDNAGNFVVSYSHDYDVSDTDVFYRAYNSSGVPLAAATEVNTSTSNDIRPSIGMSRDGSRFGIAWQRFQGNNAVYFSMYSKSGSTITRLVDSTIVPQTGVGTNTHESPSVAADDDGDIAIAWIEDINGSEQVMKRTFTPSGFGHSAIPIVPLATNISDPEIAVGRDAYREFAIAYRNGDTTRVAGTLNSGTTDFDLEVNFNAQITRSPAISMVGHSFVVGFEHRVVNENQQKVQVFGRGAESSSFGNDIGGYDAGTGGVWAAFTNLGINGQPPMSNFLVETYDPSVVWKDFLTADFDGDGFDELAARNNSTGQWSVTAANGRQVWATWAPAANWVDVQIADINGDRKADIIGRTAAGQWWAARSNSTSFTNVYLGAWSNAINWVDVRVGDFNNDFKDDIVGRVSVNGQWWLARAGGSVDAPTITNVPMGVWSTAVSWEGIMVGDFDGDGDSDLAGRANGNWWIGRSNGSTITNQFWGSWSQAVAWTDLKVGDFDMDGRDDILGRVGNTGSWWVARSTGSTFNTTSWGAWSGGNWKFTQIVDVNSDGQNDILSWEPTTGQWWAGISTGKTFKPAFWGAWSTAVQWTEVRVGSF